MSRDLLAIYIVILPCILLTRQTYA